MIDETKTCKECGAPLTKETTCDCDPELCHHCCKCDSKDETEKTDQCDSDCSCQDK